MCGATDRAAGILTIHGFHQFPLREAIQSSFESASVQPIVLRYFRQRRHTPGFQEAASSAAEQRETHSSFGRDQQRETPDSRLYPARCPPNAALTPDGVSHPPTAQDHVE